MCGLAALILGLLSLAHVVTASECEQSFYRNTPPERVTESGLERKCHSLGGGRTFISLHHPGRQSDVYTALHLGEHNAWGKGTAGEVVRRSVVFFLYTRSQSCNCKLLIKLHCFCLVLNLVAFMILTDSSKFFFEKAL